MRCLAACDWVDAAWRFANVVVFETTRLYRVGALVAPVGLVILYAFFVVLVGGAAEGG